jgi:hypothetical protein
MLGMHAAVAVASQKGQCFQTHDCTLSATTTGTKLHNDRQCTVDTASG